ncbi:MAG: T9SS type A sorting domain-containing protein [Janthinobacterium lividum]
MKYTFTLSRCLALLFVLLTPSCLFAQTWQWAAVNTAPASTNIHSGCTAVAFDAAGNAVVAGFFKGTVVLGSVSLTSTSSNDDLFIARFTATGACTQATAIPTKGAVSHIRALAVESTGTLVVAGETTGRLELGPTLYVSPSGTASFVARLNSSGTWTQAVAGGAGSQINALALDAQGNSVVTGLFNSSASYFGTTRLTSPSNGYHTLFAARLSAAGTWTQAVQATGASNSEGSAIALDGAGNAVVVGTFDKAAISFGTTTLPNSGGISGNTGTDIVAARFGSTGTWMQAVSAGGPDNDTATGVAIDASGIATVIGVVRTRATFGTISPLRNSTDGYAARLGTSGWLQASVNRFSGGGIMNPQTITLDQSGNAYIVEAETFTRICRVTPSGQWSSLETIGSGSGFHTVGGIARATNGDLVVVGQLQGSASFGNMDVNPDGRFMYFVARLGGVTLGTHPVSNSSQVNLFPQPAHELVTLTGITGLIRIFDACGREVQQSQAKEMNTKIDVSNLRVGAYFIEIENVTMRLLIE